MRNKKLITDYRKLLKLSEKWNKHVVSAVLCEDMDGHLQYIYKYINKTDNGYDLILTSDDKFDKNIHDIFMIIISEPEYEYLRHILDYENKFDINRMDKIAVFTHDNVNLNSCIVESIMYNIEYIVIEYNIGEYDIIDVNSLIENIGMINNISSSKNINTIEVDIKGNDMCYLININDTFKKLFSKYDINITEAVYNKYEDILIIYDNIKDKYTFVEVIYESITNMNNSVMRINDIELKFVNMSEYSEYLLIKAFEKCKYESKISPYCIFNKSHNIMKYILDRIDNDITKLKISFNIENISDITEEEYLYIKSFGGIICTNYWSNDLNCINWIELDKPKLYINNIVI